ncbi:MAG: rRNA maturation RNAse YbeY, partial [Elusimicrobia bacterium]|nr:rRNA maturation RNAse YbeY [Elusimicrobiota bacterium]
MKIFLFKKKKLPPSIRKRSLLIRKVCQKTLISEGFKRDAALNIIFTSNPEIRKINSKFLNHNRFTDVIAFNYRKILATRNSQLATHRMPFGDIFISV